jgi:hypothetical protein
MRQDVPILCGLAVLAAALAGCRQDANILLLRRDLRLQEDHIYDLEDALAEHQDRLASCHRENAALKRRLAAAEGPSGEPLPMPPSREPVPDRPVPDRPKREPPPEFNGAGPPKIDLGTETTPGEVQPKSPPPATPPDEPKRLPKTPEPSNSTHTSPTRQQGSAHTSPTRQQGTILPTAHADCPPVRSIAVNPRLTGGNDTDGKFGDEGVMLVLETKGDDGRIIEAPGELSLTILDPAESGEAAHVAQWDFTSDEVAQHFRRLRFGQGYVFDLPWPGEPPKHEQLTLRVRFTTLDGRTLTTEHSFKAEILGHDEFLTRSVRAPRIRPWTPDRSEQTNPKRERGMIDTSPIIDPASHEELAIETPVNGAEHTSPRTSTLHPPHSTPPSRPQWHPER